MTRTLLTLLIIGAGLTSPALANDRASYQQAVESLEHQLDQDPENLVLHLELAKNLYALGQFDLALKHVKYVLQHEIPPIVRENAQHFHDIILHDAKVAQGQHAKGKSSRRQVMTDLSLAVDFSDNAIEANQPKPGVGNTLNLYLALYQSGAYGFWQPGLDLFWQSEHIEGKGEGFTGLTLSQSLGQSFTWLSWSLPHSMAWYWAEESDFGEFKLKPQIHIGPYVGLKGQVSYLTLASWSSQLGGELKTDFDQANLSLGLNYLRNWGQDYQIQGPKVILEGEFTLARLELGATLSHSWQQRRFQYDDQDDLVLNARHWQAEMDVTLSLSPHSRLSLNYGWQQQQGDQYVKHFVEHHWGLRLSTQLAR